MATTKRTSSKQKLDSVLKGFENVVESQTKHNKQISELLKSISTLNTKMDTMIELLKKAGEIEVTPEQNRSNKDKDEITFSDL